MSAEKRELRKGDANLFLDSFDRPADWVEWVNAAQTEAEIEALRKRVNRGAPYGTETWKRQIAATLGLTSTLQPSGRPRKQLQLTGTRT